MYPDTTDYSYERHGTNNCPFSNKNNTRSFSLTLISKGDVKGKTKPNDDGILKKGKRWMDAGWMDGGWMDSVWTR